MSGQQVAKASRVLPLGGRHARLGPLASPGPDAGPREAPGLRQDLSPGPLRQPQSRLFPAPEAELNCSIVATKLPSPRGGIEGEVRQDLERGLQFAHIMLMVGQSQGNEALATLYALIALL
ncbi:MAG: hypothetical protein HYY05_03470, partial [Chloroflexi bacterium]|nr:hypothetical protein [Chloroflexota bacterium]